MERTEVEVEGFLRELDNPRAEDMRALDALIVAEMSGLDRALWSGVMWGGTDQNIVGYGAIAQPRPRGADAHWFLVGLAAQKRHLSLYVNAVESGRYLVQALAPTLGRVTVGAAAVTFPSVDVLDLDGLRAMIRRARELAPDAT